MNKSKRFITFCISIILFTLLVFVTTYQPLELSGAITMIAGIYIGAETLNKSTLK